MRPSFIACMQLFIATLPVAAQDANHGQSEAEHRRDVMSDAKREETRALLESGRKRQEAANAKTLSLWGRWTYAVCIGCGLGEPRNIRVVHTTPGRVLAGIPAAQDDAREQIAAQRAHRTRKILRIRQAVINEPLAPG